jgi:hypothetical protein
MWGPIPSTEKKRKAKPFETIQTHGHIKLNNLK